MKERGDITFWEVPYLSVCEWKNRCTRSGECSEW